MKQLKIIFNYLAIINADDNAIVITITVKRKKHVLCVIIKNLKKKKKQHIIDGLFCWYLDIGFIGNTFINRFTNSYCLLENLSLVIFILSFITSII